MTDFRTGQHQAGALDPKLLIGIIVVVIVAIGIWVWNQEDPEPEQPATQSMEPKPEPRPMVPETVQQAPDIPEQKPTALPEEAPLEPEEELPPLTESDELARETLGTLSEAPEYERWLHTDDLLQKSTSIIDGLSKGNVLYKIIPIPPPPGSFKVMKQDDRIYLDESNYQRFDNVVATITSIPPEGLAAAFQAMRPLLEEAYGDLGNPPENVDNSLVAAIDLALATPDVSGPVALKQESVLYQFADPKLESLPGLQKQLIRMGPQNRGRIKAYLADVRAALMNEADQ